MVGNGSLPPQLGGDTPSKISRTAFGLILASPVICGFGAPGLWVSCSKKQREANLKRCDLQRLLFALRPERALRAQQGSYNREASRLYELPLYSSQSVQAARRSDRCGSNVAAKPPFRLPEHGFKLFEGGDALPSQVNTPIRRFSRLIHPSSQWSPRGG